MNSSFSPALDLILHAHIGLPKSASTSIQLCLAQNPPANYLGWRLPQEGSNMGYSNSLLEEFFRYQVPYAHEIEFDRDYWIDAFKNEFASLLGQEIPLYLSDEIFSGMGPNYNLLFHPTDLGKMLHRLEQVFDKLKLLLVIRKPQAFLKSYYKQLLVNGYNVPFGHFVQKTLNKANSLSQFFCLDQFLKRADKSNQTVTVIPFEALIKKEARAFQTLSDFFGITIAELPHVNEGLDSAIILDRFCYNLKTPNEMGLQTSVQDYQASVNWFNQLTQRPDLLELAEPLHTELQKASHQLSTELNTLLDWDLEKYGYFKP